MSVRRGDSERYSIISLSADYRGSAEWWRRSLEPASRAAAAGKAWSRRLDGRDTACILSPAEGGSLHGLASAVSPRIGYWPKHNFPVRLHKGGASRYTLWRADR